NDYPPPLVPKVALMAGLLLLASRVLVRGRATAQPTAEAVPRTLEGGTADWRQVSAGASHSCGIRTSGRLYCWGNDTEGQLGDGGGNIHRLVPKEVSGGGTDWASVSAGGAQTCALRTSGRLYCWGDDAFGELGDGGTNTDRPTPTEGAGHATNRKA